MPNLFYPGENEWTAYTIEEELDKLERLALAQKPFSDEEMESLGHCVVRLNRIAAGLATGAGEEKLPDWLQRTRASTGTSISGTSKSALST